MGIKCSVLYKTKYRNLEDEVFGQLMIDRLRLFYFIMYFNKKDINLWDISPRGSVKSYAQISL